MNSVRPFRSAFFVQPFVPEGDSPGGIHIAHHKSIPAIFGRVTALGPDCRQTRVGDWVVFAPNRPVRLKWSGGHVYALRESQVLGIVMPPDYRPWFA